uniref:STAS domain-containing protein n=1 Tax=Mesocestoides corti TaxID=53468 RepID=A0A5K3FSS6_MESCO
MPHRLWCTWTNSCCCDNRHDFTDCLSDILRIALTNSLLYRAILGSTPAEAVLASVVCVALTSTFKKILDLRRLWKVSKVDASIWLVSFLATLTIDIVYGVAIGFIYSLLTVVSRSQYGDRFLLGSARDTDLYSELKRFEELHELDGIKIIRYDGPVYFANVDSFQKTVYRLSGVNPTLAQQQAGKKQLRCRLFLFKSRSGDARKATCPVAADKKDRTDAAPTDSYSTVACEPENDGDMSKSPAKQLRFVILDASGWMFTDTVGM